MKKIILLFFSFLISVMFSLASFAENFIITNYDVLLDVKKNRDIMVTEYIDVHFTVPSHGIFRNIPTSGKLYYEDGKTASLKAKISDVNVNHMFSVSPNGSNTRIKIGNPNRTVSGNQKYVIKYLYSMGPDKLKDKDELYFNLIGTEWGTQIQNVDFKVVLPTQYENINATTGFSLGSAGISGYNPSDLTFSIQNNKDIIGKVHRTLYPNEGLTIRTILPDNYFEKTHKLDEKIIVLVVMVFLAFVAFCMWYIWGRDEKVIPVVNFYPPKNKNSAEVGVEYNGLASDKEVASLIMFLASKGYLEIEDDGISYTLKKLKDYDGKNPFEKRMMITIFKESNSVTIEELHNSSFFYSNCIAILNALNKIKNYIFDKNANSIEKMVILVVCIIGLLLSIIYVLADYSFDLIFSPVSFVLLFPIIGTLVVCSVVYNVLNGSMSPAQKATQGIFITIWGSMFIGMPLFVFILPMCSNLSENYPVLLLGLACIIVSVICLLNMPKRNKQGRLALGHILGFKQFLEVAEKHRLESLLAENPNYISEILPFAYVLGVLDKIIPVLEELSFYSQPAWYKGHMSVASFSNFASKLESASMPSYSNGGISRSSGGSGRSGGGRSGGGGGGGGGGSW